MKNKRVVKTFRALPSVGNAVTGEGARAPNAPERPPPMTETLHAHDIAGTAANSEAFREMLLRRFTTPYIPRVPYRHWGINE